MSFIFFCNRSPGEKKRGWENRYRTLCPADDCRDIPNQFNKQSSVPVLKQKLEIKSVKSKLLEH